MTISVKLGELIKSVEPLIGGFQSSYDGTNVYSLEDRINLSISLTEDPVKKSKLYKGWYDLKDFYNTVPDRMIDRSAGILITTTKTNAYLTLIPPRGGKIISLEHLFKQIGYAGIKYGLDKGSVESAWDKAFIKRETILGLEIARSKLPTRGEDSSLELSKKYFNKESIFIGDASLAESINERLNAITEGDLIAKIFGSTFGNPGVDVRGKILPGIKGKDFAMKVGRGIISNASNGELWANTNGYLILNNDEIDVVPIKIIEKDIKPGEDIKFPGIVIIKGNVNGPVSLLSKDLFISGDVQNAFISAYGDIFIEGNINGKNATVIESEGRVHVNSVSDAEVRCLDSLIVRDKITDCNVICNSDIIIKSPAGMISGGKICALKGIYANNIGTCPNIGAEIVIGHDMLSGKLLNKIEDKILSYERSLARIQMMKQRIAHANLDITSLSPEKKELYISVINKEREAKCELELLLKRRSKVSESVKRIYCQSA